MIRRLEVPGRERLAGPDGRPLPRPRVPLGTLLDGRDRRSGRSRSSATTCTRRRRSTGAAAPGVSSGEALKAMEEVADRDAAAVDGLRVDGDRVPGEAGRAARRSSSSGWPCCSSTSCWPRSTRAGCCRSPSSWSCRSGCSGVVGGGATSAGMDNNIYTQIGIVLIIALASKNAILIVEFARELRLAGRSRSARRRSRRRGCGSGRSS